MGEMRAELPQADSDPTPLPSEHPTAVPPIDVEALATVTFRDARPASPLDISIPVRTRVIPRDVRLRAGFLFLHVDGRSSIAQIAAIADVPLADAITCFIELLAAGAIELRGATASVVPQSGVQRKDEG